MFSDGNLSKVTIRSLPLVEPPIPPEGGRLRNEAGEMARVVNGENFSFAAYIEFQDNVKKLRGNHYHTNKVETLYIISGSLEAVYCDLDTREAQKVILKAGDLVTIQPRCAHVYLPLEYAQALELAGNPYDAGDTAFYDMASYFAVD